MITVRIAHPSDGAQFAGIYGPIVRDTAISFEIDPPSAEEMAARVEKCLPQFPWLVAERAGEVLGYVYARPHGDRAAYRWSCEFGVYLAEKARGQGLGKRLYAALIALVRRQGYHSAFAGITLPNTASVALHESLGFYPQGRFEECGYKFSAWHDVGRWRLALSDSAAAPREPTAFAELAADEAVLAQMRQAFGSADLAVPA